MRLTEQVDDQMNFVFVQGLTSYFDKALGMMLLYEEERAEYKEFRAQNAGKRMSDVYGTPHLLRLLVKLPLLLNQVRIKFVIA